VNNACQLAPARRVQKGGGSTNGFPDAIQRFLRGLRRFLLRVAAPTAILFLFAVHCSSGGWGQDELDCQQAVAHLTDCCPSFPASSINCESENQGELCAHTVPAFSVTQSQCITSEDCSTLRSSGVCQRAEQAFGNSGVAVCP